MNLSLKRVNAIFQKDFKDFSRNMAVSITIVLPLLVALFYKWTGVDNLQANFMVFNMTFALVATFVQCCLIAEEKEKNTLRGLMLSPASTLEILSGKSLLSFVLTLGVLVLSGFMLDYKPANLLIVSSALVLSSFFYIAIGTMLGLIAKSVMESSVIVLPVLGVFSFGSFVLPLAEKYPVLKVAEYLPSVQLIEIAEKAEAGATFSAVLAPFGIIALWVAAVAALTVIVYRKRMVD